MILSTYRKEALYALTQLSIEMNDKKMYNHYMEKFYFLKEKGMEEERKVLSNHISLKYYLQTGHTNNRDEICKRVEEDLVKYIGKLDKDMELENMFLITKFYFYQDDFKTALIKNNDILSHSSIKFRKDIYIQSKIFNLLIHYELGNTGLVDYLTDSTKKILRNDSELYQVELRR